MDRLEKLPQLIDVTSDLQNKGLSMFIQHRPGRRRALRHHRRPRSTTCSTTSSASASSRPSTRSRTSTASSTRSSPRWRARWRRSTTSTCRARRRQAGAAVGHRHLRGTHRAAAPRPVRPVPGHHHLLQPGAGLCAGPGGRRHRRRPARDRHAALDHDALPGRGAGLPEVARQPAPADPGRHRHRLHRAGRALRELHPPDHDPLDPAVGRHRRAARADAGGHRPQHRGHHRHRAADRHREEERDHDDRLRPRRRAQRGQGAAGGDPPGLPAALPADPDDHGRGPGRRPAADAGHRHRLGAAPAARPHHRRRPDRQPAADAVHHAGDLPRLRPARPPASRRAASTRRSIRCATEAEKAAP